MLCILRWKQWFQCQLDQAEEGLHKVQEEYCRELSKRVRELVQQIGPKSLALAHNADQRTGDKKQKLAEFVERPFKIMSFVEAAVPVQDSNRK